MSYATDMETFRSINRAAREQFAAGDKAGALATYQQAVSFAAAFDPGGSLTSADLGYTADLLGADPSALADYQAGQTLLEKAQANQPTLADRAIGELATSGPVEGVAGVSRWGTGFLGIGTAQSGADLAGRARGKAARPFVFGGVVALVLAVAVGFYFLKVA